MPVFWDMEAGKQDGRNHYGKAPSHRVLHDGEKEAAKYHFLNYRSQADGECADGE